MVHDKTSIGTIVWHGRRKAVISSPLLGPDGAGDYMCPEPAFEITYEDGTKAQVEPKDLDPNFTIIRKPLDVGKLNADLAEQFANMTPDRKAWLSKYVRKKLDPTLYGKGKILLDVKP